MVSRKNNCFVVPFSPLGLGNKTLIKADMKKEIAIDAHLLSIIFSGLMNGIMCFSAGSNLSPFRQ